MKSTLLNVSGKIRSFEIEIFDSIQQVTLELGIPYLVVGASARDLVLHHAHGVNIIRATGDIDFAIQLETWSEFEALKTILLERGFKNSDQKQRLISPSGLPLDIVPFGAIEDENARIKWQPEDVIEMHVLGFREAIETADIVRLRDSPPLDVPIVTMAGLSILKIIAWTSRLADIRRKDAIDLLYLLKHYERIPSVIERLYEIGRLPEKYDWDISLAAAHLLGSDAAEILHPSTIEYFSSFQAGEMAPLGINKLVEEMSNDNDQYDRNLAFMNSYLLGLND
jgi:predicted nucleotidyltransferase